MSTYTDPYVAIEHDSNNALYLPLPLPSFLLHELKIKFLTEMSILRRMLSQNFSSTEFI